MALFPDSAARAALNRTSVGLKQHDRPAQPQGAQDLNRTSVGLKRSICQGNLASRCSPQSNQRGIETKP